MRKINETTFYLTCDLGKVQKFANLADLEKTHVEHEYLHVFTFKDRLQYSREWTV